MKIKNLLKKSNRIKYFGGASVSTESSIPDFRSVDGLYIAKIQISTQGPFSHTFFRIIQREFYEFYRNKMICKKAEQTLHIKTC